MKLLPALSFFTASLLFSTFTSAHSGHEHSEVAEVTVSDAQVREFLPASKATVAYLTITNPSDHATVLTKAELDGLGRVEIHQHTHVDGMMKMQQVLSLEISAHSQVEFKPGGYHLMVFEPEDELKAGQERKLTLYFKNGNRVFAQAKVVSLQEMSEQAANKSEQHSHH
ncbi:copper chaperone PCu(A)C [Pseudoalteromonas sp. PAR1]|uniref:copper chaperone PCu(A)C n=1 Tax=Pseudoalteromonas sp. PAR1 TaxID=2853443 RepID=UPI00248C7CFC|nr:copper chaperone PCu(A)C [Pseudoalteromonas sp. PAR1]